MFRQIYDYISTMNMKPSAVADLPDTVDELVANFSIQSENSSRVLQDKNRRGLVWAPKEGY